MTMIMSMYSSLTQVDDHPKIWKFKVVGVPTTEQFCYRENLLNHYRYHNQFNDHNNCRHNPISTEDTWGMKHWSDSVHAFLIVAAEVNTRKAAHNFQNNDLSISGLTFCCKLDFKLIHNTLDEKMESVAGVQKLRPRVDHHETRMI